MTFVTPVNTKPIWCMVLMSRQRCADLITLYRFVQNMHFLANFGQFHQNRSWSSIWAKNRWFRSDLADVECFLRLLQMSVVVSSIQLIITDTSLKNIRLVEILNSTYKYFFVRVDQRISSDRWVVSPTLDKVEGDSMQ